MCTIKSKKYSVHSNRRDHSTEEGDIKKKTDGCSSKSSQADLKHTKTTIKTSKKVVWKELCMRIRLKTYIK